MQRRSFLKHAAAAAAAASVPLSAFATRVEGKPRSQGTGYGPLVSALDETTGLPLLMLPEGFRYLSLGGDLMQNGARTPAPRRYGAMHCRVTASAVRNHELRRCPATWHDPAASGGTTTVEFGSSPPASRRGRA